MTATPVGQRGGDIETAAGLLWFPELSSRLASEGHTGWGPGWLGPGLAGAWAGWELGSQKANDFFFFKKILLQTTAVRGFYFGI